MRQGQIDAARALGLTPGRVVRLVVIPQAMPVIIPPITSQYLNLIKNSSFGAAIAYPEIVAVFMGSALVSTGQSIEIIAITLGDLPDARPRRVAVHELVQRAPSPGDAMTRSATRYARVVRMTRPLRQRLFATPIDAAITLVCLYIVWRISVPLVHWLLLDATWHGTSRDDCKGSGACWVFIRARFGQFMYGQYPVPERWRVDIVGRAVWCW